MLYPLTSCGVYPRKILYKMFLKKQRIYPSFEKLHFPSIFNNVMYPLFDYNDNYLQPNSVHKVLVSLI